MSRKRKREAHAETRATFARYAKYDCGVDWDGNADSTEYADLSERMHFVIGTPETVAAQLAGVASGLRVRRDHVPALCGGDAA